MYVGRAAVRSREVAARCYAATAACARAVPPFSRKGARVSVHTGEKGRNACPPRTIADVEQEGVKSELAK